MVRFDAGMTYFVADNAAVQQGADEAGDARAADVGWCG
jgi:hypothetical protein